MSEERRKSIGDRGEQLAAEHLIRRGCSIVERNYRTRWGELDIIACERDTLIFCEVKTRVASQWSRDPLESAHARKQAQVRRMAAQWLAERKERPRVAELRFDAIGVTLDPAGELVRLDHLEAAF